MSSWVFGFAGTFAVSLILANWFLRLRCRGIGPPFRRRARPWALLIVVGTAAVSSGVGLLLAAATRNALAAYAGIVVPAGLWFAALPPRRDLDMRPRTLAAAATLPFSLLYERLGDDMDAWCETRLQAASDKPQWIADAARYYYHQVRRGLKDTDALDKLSAWEDSITHRIDVVRLIELDTSPARIRASLDLHPCTQDFRKYSDDDLPRLSRRLESDARNELHLFLATVYRLGYHAMLIYPYRPSTHRFPARRAEPTSPDL